MTHINAFIKEAQEAIAASKAATKQAEDAVQRVIDRLNDDVQETTPPKEPSFADAGEAADDTKEVKYK